MLLRNFRLIILGVIFILPLNLFGQRKNYNCRIFEQIGKAICHDKLKSMTGLSLVTDPSTSKREVIPFEKDRSQKATDSIIAAFDTSIDGDVVKENEDALLLIDTLNFFTPQCNLKIGKMSFSISNNISDYEFYKSKAIGILTSIGTKDDNLVVTILFPKNKYYLNYYFHLKYDEIILTAKKRLPIYIE